MDTECKKSVPAPGIMDTECKKSVPAPGIMGFDYRNVQLLAPEKPWHLMMVQEENANIPTAVEGDRQKPADEKSATISGEGESENYSVAEAKDNSVLVDFEKICALSDHDGDHKSGIRMEDTDYMKKRLMEWVHAVAAYVRFLHASAHIT